MSTLLNSATAAVNSAANAAAQNAAINAAAAQVSALQSSISNITSGLTYTGAALTSNLAVGNLAFCPTTGNMYVGTPNGNAQLATSAVQSKHMIGQGQNQPHLYVVVDKSGLEAPNTDKFKKAKDIFVTDLRVDYEGANMYAYHTWKLLFEDQIDDYGTVVLPEGAFAAFASRESRAVFEEWLEAYIQRFFPEAGRLIGPLPFQMDGHHVGYAISDAKPEPDGYVAVRPSARLQTWAWIVKHCHGRVYRTLTGWFFEDETDAVFFKMRPEDDSFLI